MLCVMFLFNPFTWLYAVCGLSFFLSFRYAWTALKWRRRTRGRPLPPGPKPLPVVGNLFDIPTSSPWTRYRDLCAKYGVSACFSSTASYLTTIVGDVLYFQTLGQSLVILGSYKAAFDLLEKRSSNFSDRPQTPMFEL